jgi:RNA methyltransferase, TrmH family
VRRLRRRRGADAFLVEGYRGVSAAVAARRRVREVYVAPELFLGADQWRVARLAEAGGARVMEVGADAFRSIAGRPRPDGLAAVVERWSIALERLELGTAPLVAVADGVERPGNLGTIVRTASAAGADALVVAGSRTDVFHADVVQGSVGALFELPVAQASAERAIARLRAAGTRIVAASPDGDAAYWQADYEGAVAVVVGSERHGVSPPWRAAADETVCIPMGGAADSVNVAVAAGVVLFEAARQRAASV